MVGDHTAFTIRFEIRKDILPPFSSTKFEKRFLQSFTLGQVRDAIASEVNLPGGQLALTLVVSAAPSLLLAAAAKVFILYLSQRKSKHGPDGTTPLALELDSMKLRSLPLGSDPVLLVGRRDAKPPESFDTLPTMPPDVLSQTLRFVGVCICCTVPQLTLAVWNRIGFPLPEHIGLEPAVDLRLKEEAATSTQIKSLRSWKPHKATSGKLHVPRISSDDKALEELPVPLNIPLCHDFDPEDTHVIDSDLLPPKRDMTFHDVPVSAAPCVPMRSPGLPNALIMCHFPALLLSVPHPMAQWNTHSTPWQAIAPCTKPSWGCCMKNAALEM